MIVPLQFASCHFSIFHSNFMQNQKLVLWYDFGCFQKKLENSEPNRPDNVIFISSYHYKKSVKLYCRDLMCMFRCSFHFYHLTAIYSHLSEKEKGDLMYITTIASKLANTTLPSIKTTVAGRVKTKVLRMVTSSQSPVLTLDTLPSGRYRTLKHRTNLRKLCFRNVAAKVLNDIFF